MVRRSYAGDNRADHLPSGFDYRRRIIQVRHQVGRCRDETTSDGFIPEQVDPLGEVLGTIGNQEVPIRYDVEAGIADRRCHHRSAVGHGLNDLEARARTDEQRATATSAPYRGSDVLNVTVHDHAATGKCLDFRGGRAGQINGPPLIKPGQDVPNEPLGGLNVWRITQVPQE